jgi:cytidine deaminase
MNNNIPEDLQNLIEKAIEAQKIASAKYSNFKVGAALEDSEGKVWTGCNVESSSYGLSICAERVALFKALSENSFSFKRIAVAAGGNCVASPCGACRQLLSDYASGIEVILYNPEIDDFAIKSMDELLPMAFTDENLKGNNS